MKVAMVTGAGIRVGKAIARKLAAANFHVICRANSSFGEASNLVQELKSCGGSAEAIQADLSDMNSVKSLGEHVKKKYARLSLLVNNAGIYERSSFEEVTMAAYEKMQAINVQAPFFLTQLLLPLLREAKGTVVNITDSSLNRLYSHYSHYFVSKSGLEILTKALAVELAPDVRVNGIGPGTVAFPPEFTNSLKESIEAKIPMKRVGCEDDIANALLYLANDATFVTGQILCVDGGSSLA